MGLPKFYQSGISRLEKEQRVARNKEINVVKDSEAVDDAAVAANTAAIALNTAKTGISAGQASEITVNTAKVSMRIGTGAEEALAGNTTTISEGQASQISANRSFNQQSLGLCLAVTAFMEAAAAEGATLANCAAAYEEKISTTCDE